MLQMGPYPQHLKERIAGPNGHMSNHEMADYLSHHFSQLIMKPKQPLLPCKRPIGNRCLLIRH
jgi:hypothetical protein